MYCSSSLSPDNKSKLPIPILQRLRKIKNFLKNRNKK